MLCYAIYGTKNGTFANMEIVHIYIYVCILKVCRYAHEQNFEGELKW